MKSDPISLCSACLACWPRRAGSASMQPFCNSHVVRDQFPHLDELQCLNALHQLGREGGRLVARQNGVGLGAADDSNRRHWLGGRHVPGEHGGLQLRRCTWLCRLRDWFAYGWW